MASATEKGGGGLGLVAIIAFIIISLSPKRRPPKK